MSNTSFESGFETLNYSNGSSYYATYCEWIRNSFKNLTTLDPYNVSFDTACVALFIKIVENPKLFIETKKQTSLFYQKTMIIYTPFAFFDAFNLRKKNLSDQIEIYRIFEDLVINSETDDNHAWRRFVPEVRAFAASFFAFVFFPRAGRGILPDGEIGILKEGNKNWEVPAGLQEPQLHTQHMCNVLTKLFSWIDEPLSDSSMFRGLFETCDSKVSKYQGDSFEAKHDFSMHNWGIYRSCTKDYGKNDDWENREQYYPRDNVLLKVLHEGFCIGYQRFASMVKNFSDSNNSKLSEKAQTSRDSLEKMFRLTHENFRNPVSTRDYCVRSAITQYCTTQNIEFNPNQEIQAKPEKRKTNTAEVFLRDALVFGKDQKGKATEHLRSLLKKCADLRISELNSTPITPKLLKTNSLLKDKDQKEFNESNFFKHLIKPIEIGLEIDEYYSVLASTALMGFSRKFDELLDIISTTENQVIDPAIKPKIWKAALEEFDQYPSFEICIFSSLTGTTSKPSAELSRTQYALASAMAYFVSMNFGKQKEYYTAIEEIANKCVEFDTSNDLLSLIDKESFVNLAIKSIFGGNCCAVAGLLAHLKKPLLNSEEGKKDKHEIFDLKDDSPLLLEDKKHRDLNTLFGSYEFWISLYDNKDESIKNLESFFSAIWDWLNKKPEAVNSLYEYHPPQCSDPFDSFLKASSEHCKCVFKIAQNTEDFSFFDIALKWNILKRPVDKATKDDKEKACEKLKQKYNKLYGAEISHRSEIQKKFFHNHNDKDWNESIALFNKLPDEKNRKLLNSKLIQYVLEDSKNCGFYLKLSNLNTENEDLINALICEFSLSNDESFRRFKYGFQLFAFAVERMEQKIQTESIAMMDEGYKLLKDIVKMKPIPNFPSEFGQKIAEFGQKIAEFFQPKEPNSKNKLVLEMRKQFFSILFHRMYKDYCCFVLQAGGVPESKDANEYIKNDYIKLLEGFREELDKNDHCSSLLGFSKETGAC
jgi:hypothetical protein